MSVLTPITNENFERSTLVRIKPVIVDLLGSLVRTMLSLLLRPTRAKELSKALRLVRLTSTNRWNLHREVQRQLSHTVAAQERGEVNPLVGLAPKQKLVDWQ